MKETEKNVDGSSTVNGSPEAVVVLQDIHDCPCGWSQEFVHSEQGGKASSLVMSSNAGVLDAKVLAAQWENVVILPAHTHRTFTAADFRCLTFL